MDNEMLIPVPVFDANQARLNITWSGQNGDLLDPVPFDLPDATIRALASEAVRGGSVAGIRADANVDFGEFVVDRFGATDTVPFSRILLRPKTPFGA